jgi:predicted nucleotidyltransferase
VVSLEERAALTAAELLADSLTDIVGAATRSVILHGSLSSGGFRPGRSDIDMLAVIDGGLADAQAAALERLVRQADTRSAVGIDVHVVTSEVAGAPARAPSLELHIGRYEGSSIELEVERRVAASPDLPAELSMALADGRACMAPYHARRSHPFLPTGSSTAAGTGC